MTEAELRKRAEEEAKACRSPGREDLCPYLQPGAPLTYEDCPMRPRKCWHVSAKQWFTFMRDAYQFHGELEEDA